MVELLVRYGCCYFWMI